MRNPLKKITKKINLRLANNAAQHSSAAQKVESPNSKKQQKDAMDGSSSRTLGLTDHVTEDPLFNNRSSRLRLALAESKKNQNKKNSPTAADNSNTGTPKKKKRTSRLSFGGSRKTNPDKEQAQPTTPNRRSSTGSTTQNNNKQKAAPPQTPPKEGYVYADEADISVKNPNAKFDRKLSPRQIQAKFDSPTVASQQMRREKAPVTAAPLKPPPTAMVDPNLERIARAAAALDNVGNELFERGEYDKAMAHYVKALKLKNRSLAGSQQLDELGNPLDVPMPPPTQAKAALPTTANDPQSSDNPTEATPENNDLWISVATSINNIGYLRQQSGQASAEETMQAYQNSLQIKRRVLGKDNLSVGKTLNNLGTVHYLKREYEQALEAYGEALQIMMASLGAGHLDVGTVHSNMGDVYWAQSGDTSFGKAKKDSPQLNYQTSRAMALRHYRRSLEIRWEELQDHRDPKIIRLLEKIAALEMGESFLAMVQNSHKHRLSPKGSGTTATTAASTVDPDEAMEAEQAHHELQTLHMEVRQEVKNVDMMERKMAIDMVKDKLRLVREMKKLSNLNLYELSDDEMSLASGARTPIRVQPLSPVQRDEALSAVKERLQQLRDARTQEPDVMRRHTVGPSSDLKEADRSPTHFFMSQRASQLLNRTFLKPSPDNNGLDGIRKLSFHESENDLDAVSHDGSEISDITRSSLSVSRRSTQALEKGLDALRSHNIKARTAGEIIGNPWMIASTMTSPEKTTTPPETPTPIVSMSAF